MINWKRVLRTALQAALGGLVTFVGGITLDMGIDALALAGLQFVVTVATAVLMNMQKQLDEVGNDEKPD